ncbi:hypothetical protein AAEX63_12675 [Luteococcus sp. H138]|uniref:hypothetical protein n=1 Tax=unclassified Luteococcus TaxID=2639923 RepID=UPI00313CD171
MADWSEWYAFGGPQYGTTAWHEAYTSARQVIESKNNQLKSGITFTMDNVRTRLMRGFTNQLLIMTMICMATNLMIVRDVLDVEAGEETTRKPSQPSRRPSGRLRYRRSSPIKTRPAVGRPKEPDPLE